MFAEIARHSLRLFWAGAPAAFRSHFGKQRHFHGLIIIINP